MNRELKKRKKRFWVLCMAAVLLLYNILPMTAYATYYDADVYASFDVGDMLYPGDELKMWNEPVGAFDGPPKITYVDTDGTTDLRVCYVQTEDPEMTGDPNCHIHTVKEYSEFTGNSADAELLKAWEVIHVYRSGSEATKVSLKPLLYTRSNIVYHLDSAAGEKNAETNPTTYLEGVGVASLEPASKTGYTFGGWYSDAAFNTEVTSISTTQTGDVKLYAKFTASSYRISYELNGGTNDAANPTDYTYGVGVAGFAAASKAEHTFAGWYSDAEFNTEVTSISATRTGDVTLYAKFTANRYNISYELNGGTNDATNPADYTYGIGVTGFADASKTGYNFDGWYSDAAFTTRVTEISATDMGNKTLYAKFTSNSYTITYVLDGGTNDTTNPTGYTYGIGVTLADASKTGYTFDGWYSDAAFTTRVTSISAAATGNMTLYAKFTANASTPTPNPGVTPTPTPNPGVTPTPTPAPAATVTEAPSVTAAPMVKDDVPKTGDGMQGILLFGAMLLSGIGLVVVGCRKSFTDEKQG